MAIKTTKTLNSEKPNKDVSIHQEYDKKKPLKYRYANNERILVDAEEKLARLPSSFPHLVLGPRHRLCQPPLYTQVDTSLPANKEAPHRWEKQLLSKFPGSIPGTCPSQFYNTLPLHKVLLRDKYGLCK